MSSPPPPPDVRSWVFWRKRLTGVLVVSAVALAVTQVLPSLPTDQPILFASPAGHPFETLEIDYRSPEGVTLGGVEISPPLPASTLAHTLRLPHGSYIFSVRAELRNKGGEAETLVEQHRVELDGSTHRLAVGATSP